ncbi:MAG: HPF/RaiA family ribosome-associated protein, partial [Polyangiales bacterium]
MTIQQETRAPFAAHTTKADKRRAGRTESGDTPLEIRTGDHAIDDPLRAWVYERIGRQLGKFAPQIERIQVRFGDDNSVKGGVDRCCMVHVVLSKLPPVIVEMHGGTEREAFDLAARSVERAVRKNLGKHGYSMRNGRHGRNGQDHSEHASAAAPAPTPTDDIAEDSLFGKRVGRSHEQLMMLARPDLMVDTSMPGISATDRKAGGSHTGRRNVKLNTAGMTRSLEDSTTDRPSRKSTRGGTNHVKPDNPLTQRTKSSVLSP